jgi:hypothetical protein
LDGLVLDEIWRSVLRIPCRATVVEELTDVVASLPVVVSLLVTARVVIGLVVIVREAAHEFLLEESDVTEVSRSAARVGLPRPERDPVVRLEIDELRIVLQIRWQDEPAGPDLVTLLSSCMRHWRDRHAAGVEVPASSW